MKTILICSLGSTSSSTTSSDTAAPANSSVSTEVVIVVTAGALLLLLLDDDEEEDLVRDKSVISFSSLTAALSVVVSHSSLSPALLDDSKSLITSGYFINASGFSNNFNAASLEPPTTNAAFHRGSFSSISSSSSSPSSPCLLALLETSSLSQASFNSGRENDLFDIKLNLL